MTVLATDKLTITGKGLMTVDGSYDFSGTITDVYGRVGRKNKDQYTADSVVRIYDYVAWLPPQTEISIGDKVTFDEPRSSGTTISERTGTGIEAIVVTLNVVTMIDGSIHHKKVMVKRFGA